MRILFYEWNSFMNPGMENALKELEIEYDVFFYQFSDWEKDDCFLNKFESVLKKKEYDCVLSVNYAPLVSKICEDMGIIYVSWVYDSPIHIRNISTMYNKCNRIYFFDRGQADAYRMQGIDARYMPLAVDTRSFATNILLPRGRYQSDISFVGQLYQTEYRDCIAPLDEYTKGYLEGIMKSQSQIYGAYLLDELVTDKLVEQINAIYQERLKGQFQIDRRELEFLVASEITGRERYMALALLSKYFDVHLYSNDKDERLSAVQYDGYVDYYKKMPEVFVNSRINLNISLKTIRTGIPLRVLDIMGCGGFALTNYQAEIPEYFEVGTECVVYENMGDLVEKADYYLKHEEERERIAMAGLERVHKDFRFRDRLKEMLDINK